MYKKLLLITVAAVSCLSTTVFAGKDKIYIGGQVVKVHMNYDGSAYTLPSDSVDDNTWGWRLYGGYSFTNLLAAELGYGYYGRPEFEHKPTGNKQDILQQGIDLLGKLSVPLDYGFGLYAKGGLMLVHRGSLESRGGFFVSKESNSKLVPVGGLGVSYNFCPVWSADLSLTATPSNGDLPKMYIYGLGLTYKFGRVDGGDPVYYPN